MTDKPIYRLLHCQTDVQRDPKLQMRDQLYPETVERYSYLDLKVRQPIVFWDGEHNWLADGYHWVAAAEVQAEREKDPEKLYLEFEVRQGSFDDARLFATGANITHGLRLTTGEATRCIQVRVEILTARAQRINVTHLASEFGVAPATARRARDTQLGKFPSPTSRPKQPSVPPVPASDLGLTSQKNEKDSDGPVDDPVDVADLIERDLERQRDALDDGDDEVGIDDDITPAQDDPIITPAPVPEGKILIDARQLKDIVARATEKAVAQATADVESRLDSILEAKSVEIEARLRGLYQAVSEISLTPADHSDIQRIASEHDDDETEFISTYGAARLTRKLFSEASKLMPGMSREALAEHLVKVLQSIPESPDDSH